MRLAPEFKDTLEMQCVRELMSRLHGYITTSFFSNSEHIQEAKIITMTFCSI